MSGPPGTVRRQLEFLLNGFDFYAHRERVVADDLLVRQRAGSSLAAAEARLRDLETAARREWLPPPTRARSGADPEALARVSELARVRGRVADAEALVRAAPLAHRDRTWARLRSESTLLELLLEHDLALVRAADGVREAVDGLTLAGLQAGAGPALAAVVAALDRWDAAFRQRQADLDLPL